MEVYKTLGIENTEWQKNKSGVTFMSDVVSGLTFFIWTIVFISLLVSWLMLIFAGSDEKLAEKWKSGIKYSAIWLFLVVASYSIIKFIQYFMKG